MAGAADALDRARNAFRRRHHDDEIDRADVDAELEAGGANDRAQFAILQPVFDFETHAAIERSVMHFNLVARAPAVILSSAFRFVLRRNEHL